MTRSAGRERSRKLKTATLVSVGFVFLDKSLGDTASDVISDSSGVGTSQSDTTNSLSIPGTTVVCVESYNSGILGHLNINQGDILEGICHFISSSYSSL